MTKPKIVTPLPSFAEVVAQLKDAGLYVHKSEMLSLDFSEMTPVWKRGVGRIKPPKDNEDKLKVSKRTVTLVEPMRDWLGFVKIAKKAFPQLWEDIANQEQGLACYILSRAGFEIVGQGGHPPNWDYERSVDGKKEEFHVYTNPYHV